MTMPPGILETLLADQPTLAPELWLTGAEHAVGRDSNVVANNHAIASVSDAAGIQGYTFPSTTSPTPPAGLILTKLSITDPAPITIRVPRMLSSMSASVDTRAAGEVDHDRASMNSNSGTAVTNRPPQPVT